MADKRELDRARDRLVRPPGLIKPPRTLKSELPRPQCAARDRLPAVSPSPRLSAIRQRHRPSLDIAPRPGSSWPIIGQKRPAVSLLFLALRPVNTLRGLASPVSPSLLHLRRLHLPRLASPFPVRAARLFAPPTHPPTHPAPSTRPIPRGLAVPSRAGRHRPGDHTGHRARRRWVPSRSKSSPGQHTDHMPCHRVA